MITLLLSIAALIAGYFIYGKIVERKFGADPNRETPAVAKNDGVDYVPMGLGKIFLIQFLNIAGLGPIFGAIAGALWGPVAFIWIVFGCIFAGAVHDYFSGMLSVRHGGASIPEVVGKYLGGGFKKFMRFFAVILLVLVGVVFIKGPASILHNLIGIDVTILVGIIFLYYLIATMVPIDKLIGKIYPIFGVTLLIMALGIVIALIFGGFSIPELSVSTLQNMHTNSDKFPIYPLLFITIACGAISGFHSTQSPLMARCITNEKQGRKVFFGTMIAEGIVALIWAAAAMTFFGGVRELGETMSVSGHNAAWVVNEVCNGLMGKIGGIMAIVGVVAAPITSGDTAFRSARLTIADSLSLEQAKLKKRLIITIPLFAVGFILTQVDFGIIWRYFGWANQTLATLVLWTTAVYLLKQKKSFWMAFIPAVFMTSVVTSYILIAPEGFGMSSFISYFVGISVAIATGIIFFIYKSKWGYIRVAPVTEKVRKYHIILIILALLVGVGTKAQKKSDFKVKTKGLVEYEAIGKHQQLIAAKRGAGESLERVGGKENLKEGKDSVRDVNLGEEMLFPASEKQELDDLTSSKLRKNNKIPHLRYVRMDKYEWLAAISTQREVVVAYPGGRLPSSLSNKKYRLYT